MKLILIISVISISLETNAHESYTLPPQFQGSQPGPFSSDKQFFLPPESQTVLPYYPMKSFNNLPFQYLPSTITKSPIGTRSPIPIVVSSTLLPINTDDDDDEENEKHSTPLPPYLRQQYQNRTQRGVQDRREMRPVQKQYQHAIDRIDTKLPVQFNSNSDSTQQNSGMSSRSIIISDIQRDHNMDQMKSANFIAPQYVSQSGVFLSTTETAIPILRLSNEMDLDGSFSYEALGADQTHYVQHSRMENVGHDKEEQVVEGSYSYVGDDGKTYTVHYIADSNGFRASGDHLPVAPPVPEIIQRAVQFNLAEELKKPPHLKSWNGEDKENELNDSENRHHFAASPPRLNNLFTGRTPESFSHSFSHSSNTQNNLVAAASSQTPVHSVEFSDQMQNKQNSGTISPQITFLASQGAHDPSVNAPQPQQNIGRIYTTDRPTMPQLVNYEANMKDAGQESNKALWRWQYGMANLNQNMDKNQISRSSAEDDISVNFSEMTADQYTKMLEQLEPNTVLSSEKPDLLESSNNQEYYYANPNSYTKVSDTYQLDENNSNAINPPVRQYVSARETSPVTPVNKLQNNYNSYNKQNNKESQDVMRENVKSKLITHDNFIPRSQTVTRSYNYDDIGFESRKTRTQSNKKTENFNVNLNVIPLSANKNNYNHTNSGIHNFNAKINDATTQETSTLKPISKIKFTDFIVTEDSKNGFKPIFSVTNDPPKQTTTTTTTEVSIQDMIKENIFLKNIFKNNKKDHEINSKVTTENNNLVVKPIASIKTNKYASPKYIDFDQKPYNDNRNFNRKPMDTGEVMNYLSRMQFESSKVSSKPKPFQSNSKQNADEEYFTNEESQEMEEEKSNRNQQTLYQHELRGAIKNYKVLQRNNNINNGNDNMGGLKRNLSPPPVQNFDLPPLGRAGPTQKTYLPPIFV